MTQHFHRGILFYHEAAGQGNIYKELGQVTENLTQLCDELTIKLSKEEGQIVLIVKHYLPLQMSMLMMLFLYWAAMEH